MSPSGVVASADIAGPLEQRYRERSAAFRAASDTTRVTRTHWHIAIANGLGWGFDGMDGVIFALATPLIIRDFGVTLPEYRSGLQVSLLIGILGMYVWPWLADRYGRRSLLAINIALFSLLMPVIAITTTFVAFVAVRSAINFALNGEWSLGSMLVAETWPAHMRGRVIGINRGTWCFGAALAGAIATFIIAEWGWRIACVVPAVVALLAVYVRIRLPESPYWLPRLLGTEHDPDGGNLPDAHPRRWQRLFLGGSLANRLRVVAIRHHRHPAEHRLVLQGVPDRAGSDAADGRRDLAVHAGAPGQGTGRNRGLAR